MAKSTRARPSAASSSEQPYCPDEGDFIWIDLNPQLGHEQAGRRPALVLSPIIYNRPAGLCVLCPITSRVKSYPFNVAIPAGLPVTGVVLSDQIKSLAWPERKAAFIGKAPQPVLLDVRAKIKALLGI